MHVVPKKKIASVILNQNLNDLLCLWNYFFISIGVKIKDFILLNILLNSELDYKNKMVCEHCFMLTLNSWTFFWKWTNQVYVISVFMEKK